MTHTFYIITFRHPREIREQTEEGELPETVDEVLGYLKEHDTFPVWRILRCDPDIAPNDATEEIANVAYRKWCDAGHDPEEDSLPDFIWRHVSAR